MLRRPRTVSLIAVALVGALATGSAAAPAGAPRVPDPYYPADGNVGYDVLRYDIHDRYRFSDRRVSGVTTIRLVPSAELTSFNLDLLLDVDSVKVAGVEADFEKPDAHEVTVTPAAPLVAGEPVAVRVRYHGFPDAIEWQGESNWLANDHEVVTMNEPHMAAWWFPSNDHPSDKARFDIRITTGRTREVVSNGVLKSRVVHGRTATTHWRMADPMTTYLAFFAAGQFVVERGTAHGLRYYNAVSRRLGPDLRQRDLAMLRRSARITSWLQDELGEYPFATTGGLVTSLDPGFALENQSRPTYPAFVSVDLLVHELAHQWFGDSVAVARWQDIWLNEGFATYLEKRHAEASGRATTSEWLRASYAATKNRDQYWSLNIADPCAGLAPCPWWTLFAHQVYERGAMTLAALRNRIGDADFRRLLRRWVAVHEGGNATTGDFRQLAERVSDERLGTFFRAWLRADEAPPDRPRFGL